MRFADLADAGRALAPLVDALLVTDPVLVAVPPGGLGVGAAVATELGRDVVPLVTSRDANGVVVTVTVEVVGRVVVVIDDGVETGTAARAVATALRSAGATMVLLAVPVCPREVEAELRGHYDDVVAVTRPLVRRSLRWHYDTFA
jgi:putative phosphoribosyl transferase